MKLDNCTTITDEAKFVEAHTALINGRAGEDIKKPYRDRLETYYNLKNEESEKLQADPK